MNLVFFTIIIVKTLNLAIKYFIVQAISSSAILTIIILKTQGSLQLEREILFLRLRLKLGIPPFHLWFIQTTSIKIPLQIILIFTIQKILPIILILYSINIIIIILLTIGVIRSGIGGILQNSVIKLLVYSSLAHRGWILCNIILRLKIWLIYFSLYSLHLALLIKYSYNYKLYKISITNENNNSLKISLIFMLLSLGGIPPLMGFLGKIFTIFILTQTELTLVAAALIIGSLITLWFYIKICYINFLRTPLNKKVSLKLHTKEDNYMPIIYLTLIIRSLSLIIL